MKAKMNWKNWVTAGVMIIACVCCVMVLTGCDDDDPPAAAPTNADWQFQYTNGENGSARLYTLSMPWLSTDDIVTGILTISGYTLDITRTGTSVDLIVTAPDTSVFTSTGATINPAPTNSIVGTYSGDDESTSPPTTLTNEPFMIVKL